MAFTPAPTQAYQDCIFSQVSMEDQAHIDAMKPHFFALRGKFTRTQIYELLTSSWSIHCFPFPFLIVPRSHVFVIIQYEIIDSINSTILLQLRLSFIIKCVISVFDHIDDLRKLVKLHSRSPANHALRSASKFKPLQGVAYW